MNHFTREQRFPYKGRPLTPWVRLVFARNDVQGHIVLDLAVDTGDPQFARISGEHLRMFKTDDGPVARTNFGIAIGGWVQLAIPELDFETSAVVFATDQLVDAV